MTRNQEVRHECLLQLYGSGSIPLSAAHIRKVARRGGFDFLDSDIRDALYFLKGQGFCESSTQPGTGETQHVITAAGMLEWEKNHA